MVAKDFTSQNTVSLCGRIMKILRVKRDEVKIVLGIARSSKPVIGTDGKKYHPLMRDENNHVVREYVTIHFFDSLAEKIEKNQEVGDYIVVNAIVQNVRNHYDNSYKVDIWGLSVAPKRQMNKTINDHNRVNLRGKIVSSNVLNPNLAIVNLLTKCDKQWVGPTGSTITDTYKSVTPVGFYYRDGDARVAADSFTKGTWLDIKGFIKTKDKTTNSKDYETKRETFIYGIESNVIGVVQPAEDELYQEYLKVRDK